jgi:plasmid stabilization system protein ParE
MPQNAWSKKRELQYEHIKEGLETQGDSESEAEEIAARTVNKERARAGRQSRRVRPRRGTSRRDGGADCVPTRVRVGEPVTNSTKRLVARA